MKTLLTFLALLPLWTAAVAVTSVEEGTEAMKNKDYTKAIEVYQSILDQGQSSGELHYNIGVAHAESGVLGRALWHFHLADQAGLSTPDLQHNIQLVREQRMDEIEVIPEFFLTRWRKAWTSMLSSNAWSILALVFLLCGIGGLYLWRTAPERAQRKHGFSIGLPLMLLAIVLAWSAYSSAQDALYPTDGVLLAKQMDLRSAPDPESAGILTIHEGIDIDVQDEIGDWIKVRLLNGQEGWLPKAEVGLF